MILIQHVKLLCPCGRKSRIFVFVFFVVLLFLFSSINDEISLSFNYFSSFDLSNKLGLINIRQPFRLFVVRKITLVVRHFVRNFNPICRLRVARKLSNRSSGVQIPRDICTRFGRYLYSTMCSWIINSDIVLLFVQ